MKREALEHQKLYRLADELVRYGAPTRWKLAIATGIVERLWGYASIFAPDGEVRPYAIDQLARFVGWPGKSAELVDCLVASTLLDRLENRLLIHDWSVHCDRWVHRKLVRAGKTFADGQKPNVAYSDTSDRGGQPGGTPGALPTKTGTGTGTGNTPKPPRVSRSACTPGARLTKTLQEEFDRFWSHVHRKVGKQQTESEFGKLNPDRPLVDRMIAAMEAQKSWRGYRPGETFPIADPERWIKKRRWEDEEPNPEPAHANGMRHLRLASGRVIGVPRDKRVQFVDAPDACDVYELPNGVLTVREGARWL